MGSSSFQEQGRKMGCQCARQEPDNESKGLAAADESYYCSTWKPAQSRNVCVLKTLQHMTVVNLFKCVFSFQTQVVKSRPSKAL